MGVPIVRIRLCCPILLTLLLIVSLPVIAATAGGQQPFFFFVLADPQFGMYTRDKGFTRETKNFETVIAAANRLHPAFVDPSGFEIVTVRNNTLSYRYVPLSSAGTIHSPLQ